MASIGGKSLRESLNRSTSLWFPAIVGFHSDTSDFSSRMTTAGGSISNADLRAIDDFVKYSVSKSIWAKTLEFYPLAGSNLTSAAIKLKYVTDSSLTLYNYVSGNYSATTGLAGGSPRYADTNFVPYGNVSDTNFSLGFYNRSADLSAGIDIGSTTSPNTNTTLSFDGSHAIWRSSDNSAGQITSSALSPASAGLGLVLGTRTSNTDSRLYIRKTKVGEIATYGGSLTSVSLILQAYRSSLEPTPNYHSPRVFGCAGVWQGLAQSEVFDLVDGIDALMSGMERNV